MPDIENRSVITRRHWGRILGGAIAWGLTRGASAAVPPVIEHLAWDALPGDAGRERRYRADAHVLFLSLPLLHRENVGGGTVIWREVAETGGASIRLLEFTGYSRPERAAGLNRLGLLREMTHISGDGLTQSHYLGLMTSSPEESVEEARKALHSQAREVTYTAVDGRIGLADSRTVTAHFTAPSNLSIEKKGELLERARQALSTAPQDQTETNAQAANEPPFLEAVASLLRQPARKECSYSYGGNRYRLSLAQSPDSQATQHFRARGLLAADGTVIRAAGRVKREAGGAEKHFRIWFEQGVAQPLPLRIEYLPKSYLRLVFEAES